MKTAKPEKRSVSLAIRRVGHPAEVLLVRRPDDDEELAGMWGLPAASCRGAETPEQAARRVGRDKLGIDVSPSETSSGRRERGEYVLNMTLYSCRLTGQSPRIPSVEPSAVTMYTAWRWGRPEDLRHSAEAGSLCSRLLLESIESNSK